MSEPMTVRGYAKSRGIAHTSVGYQIKKGRIPLLDGKRIDPEYADFVFAEKVNKVQSLRGRGQQRVKGGIEFSPPAGNAAAAMPDANGKPDPALVAPELPEDTPDLAALRNTIPKDYNQAMFLSSVEDLMKRRAANAEAEGKLTATDRVMRAQFEMARQIRDAMFGIVPRLQDDLAAETDPAACGRMLTREIRQALESAAKQAASLEDEFANMEAEADAAG